MSVFNKNRYMNFCYRRLQRTLRIKFRTDELVLLIYVTYTKPLLEYKQYFKIMFLLCTPDLQGNKKHCQSRKVI